LRLDGLESVPVEAFVGLMVLAIAAVVYLLLSNFEERQVARDTLREIDGYQVENQREQELLAPLYQRMFGPLLGAIGRFGSRFNPPDYVEAVRLKHVRAGIYSPERVERFLALRVLFLVLVPVWLAIVFLVNPLQVTGLVQIVLGLIGVVALVFVPNSRLDSLVKERTLEVQQTLPDVLDLMVISVEAGLGFEQAVDRVIANVPGALSDEFARFMGETAAGSTRADGLRGLQERIDLPEMRSFVLAMIQADRFGVSIAHVLRGQADEMRIKRRQRAQEKAQQAPVKMLIPMVFCIFPSLFVVILGPAIINIRNSLG
jgi:tight adherence protein C